MNRVMLQIGIGLLTLTLLLSGCAAPEREEEEPPRTYGQALLLLAREQDIFLSEQEQEAIRTDAARDALLLEEDPQLLEEEYTRELLEQRLREALFPRLFAEDQEVEAWYQDRLAALDRAFEGDPGLFKSQQESYELYGGVPPLAVPQGYVRFWHILTEEEEAARQVLDRLAEGEAFGALMAQYNQDPGMREEPFSRVGYLAGPYPSTRDFMPEIKEQVLALKEPGDYSDVFVTPAGYHIVLLKEKLEAGTLSLDQAREPIAAMLTASLRQKALEEEISSRLAG